MREKKRATKKKTTTKKKAETKERSKNDPRRLANGNFAEGNTIGEGTRFAPGEQHGTPFKMGNTLAKKYRDEYADLLLEYFRRADVTFPTLEGFVEWVRTKTGEAINYSTAEAWARGDEKYADARRFQEVYAQAKAIQREKLIFGGLTKRFDPSFARFLASSLHDMREKTEQKVDANMKGEGTFNVNITYFDEEQK